MWAPIFFKIARSFYYRNTEWRKPEQKQAAGI